RDFHVTGVQTCALPISSIGLAAASQSIFRSGYRRRGSFKAWLRSNLTQVFSVMTSMHRSGQMGCRKHAGSGFREVGRSTTLIPRSEEHTSELQSRENLV